MTHCADATRRSNEQQLVDVVTILAAGILRLRERQTLPVAEQLQIPDDSSPNRLELSRESLLNGVHRG